MNKFLIIQTASIGDVILATPVVEKLHLRFPDAQIDVLVKKGNESLFFQHPFIHQTFVWDKSHQKYRHLYALIKIIRKEQYDAVVNIQRFLTSGLITVFSGAKQTIGFDKNPLSYFFSKRYPHHIGTTLLQHETERNLSLIKDLTDNSATTVKLYPTPEDEAKVVDKKTVPYITISPASLWFTKQFPKERWITFLKQYPPDVTVYVLGGKSDFELGEEIIKTSGRKNAFNLSGQLSFLASAALMRDARMNYVNDSAPMHLASSQNAPIAAIFCSTIPAFGFGPLSDQSFIIEIKDPLSCRPCGLHGYKSCPQKHFNCAMKIEMEQLLNLS